MINIWTENEINAFKKWDSDRISGKLGTPIRFSSVDKLLEWLIKNDM